MSTPLILAILGGVIIPVVSPIVAPFVVDAIRRTREDKQPRHDRCRKNRHYS